MSAEAAADAGAADDQPYAHYTDEEVAAIADRALALQMGGVGGLCCAWLHWQSPACVHSCRCLHCC
jgi:hypothetical protein